MRSLSVTLRNALAAFVGALGVLAISASDVTAEDDAGLEFFEKQVRPILTARCYGCHSGKLADGATEPKGKLRLDSREAALKGGDTAPAVVPGKPKESLLVDAINYGELYQMPPKSKLSAEEIAVLTKWVELGAPWPKDPAAAAQYDKTFDLAKRKAEHWCWQPLRLVDPPAVKNEAWIRQPLDRFILAKLGDRGLSPAPPADKRTLIRRAYFDLIGLPPTPEQVEAFVNDHSPGAFEKVVDELLASPHFGERWARHWLDLVRYAETRGHEFDYNIPGAYQYRDYVIRALNADVPYDQFVVEHVAGDLMPQPRRHPIEGFNESILGTAFWFFGEWIHSPVDIRKDETDRIDNMVDVFSKTFLGLTAACARCHDHKFDAISQQDYYALCGYLQSSSYRLARFDTMLDEQTRAKELAAIETKYRPQVSALVAESLKPKLDELATSLAAEAEKLQSELAPLLGPPKDARLIADYTRPGAADWMTDGPTFGTASIPAGQILLGENVERPIAEIATYGAARRDLAWRAMALADGSESDQGKLATFVRAGRTLKTRTFRLENGKLHYLVAGAGQIYAAVDSHAMINGPLHGQLVLETGANSDSPLRWVTHDLSAYGGHRVHVEFCPKGDADFHVLLVVEADQRPSQTASSPNELLAKICAADAATRVALAREQLSMTVELLARNKLDSCDMPAEQAPLAAWVLAHPAAAGAGSEDQKKKLAGLLDTYRAERDKIAAQIRSESRVAPAMWDGTGEDENLLIRGNPKTVGPPVPRRLLEAMASGGREPPDGSPLSASGRLELARQFVSGENPFPARVMVNRIWHHLLGRGIAPSTDNFGVLGQKPTHPELLDHLASQFMQDGWSVKRTIRSVMLSSTYQMASTNLASGGRKPPDLSADQLDPQNLLFHRANVKRLEGEAIRDAILAVSGRLDRKQFGPSIPVHLTPFMQGRGRPASSGPLDGDGRRSIYIAVRRNFLPPMMVAFDTPLPLGTVGRRNVSNVPAQALILMNDPFVIEQAKLWVRKVLAEPDRTPEERIERMYVAAFSRPPTDAETAASLAFVQSQGREYGLNETLANSDERVWTDLGHVLLNVKEFVFVN